MSDDTHDDLINLDDPSEYGDPVSQRAMAFYHVAKLADTAAAVKELCLTMLRKLNASIRSKYLGEFASRSVETKISILVSPEYLTLRSALVSALTPFPEAKRGRQAATGPETRPQPLMIDAAPAQPSLGRPGADP